jgi:hypothetical protein
MTRTEGPLRIGYRNGVGYADPDPYEIDNGDNVPVVAESRCRVWFVKRADVFFSNRDHEAGQTVWICNGSDVTPQFVVGPHGGRRPQRPDVTTYSIKVGSGGLENSERTARKKSKGKRGNKPARKSRKRTGRKSSRRRK